MLGPFLSPHRWSSQGPVRARSYLPRGPACWFDFWTEEALPAGAIATLAAPLDRLPLAVPAGAIIPMTGTADDFTRGHDEPSRSVRVFPGPGSGSSRFVLIEDDGISADGSATRVTFDLAWTSDDVTLTVAATGGYALPYGEITVVLPRAERRRLILYRNHAAPDLVRQ